MERSEVLKEYKKSVTPPGAVTLRLDLKIFWVFKELAEPNSLVNHVVPLVPVASQCMLSIFMKESYDLLLWLANKEYQRFPFLDVAGK